MMPISALLGTLYFVSEIGLQIFRRAKSGAGRTEDGGSLAVLWLVISASMFLAFNFQVTLPQARWPWLPWVNVLGIVLTLAGLAFRWYSIIYLGRFFTVNVAIAADHELIDTGPYAAGAASLIQRCSARLPGSWRSACRTGHRCWY